MHHHLRRVIVGCRDRVLVQKVSCEGEEGAVGQKERENGFEVEVELGAVVEAPSGLHSEDVSPVV